MKSFPVLFLFLAFAFQSPAQAGGRRILLPKGGDGGVFVKGQGSFRPGDTLVLQASASPYTYCYFGGLEGTEKQPIVVINEGGPVILSTGIDLEHSRFLKISGGGTAERYGFQVKNSSGVAVTIHGRSADLEVERFSAENCAFGCWIKNEASCDSTLNSWVLQNIRVHDYRLVNMKIEGFYLGSTDANNQSRPVNCNGEQKYNRPSRLGNIRIYNGYINGTGRPAIMLSNAAIGMSEIYNNVIRNVGREYNDQQGTGISLGLYTRAYVHHNDIRSTFTWGIASLGGSGLIRIEDNQVDSSGYLDGRLTPWAQNIAIDTRLTDPVDSTRFIIRNNRLSKPGAAAEHIRVWQTKATYAAGSLICGNTIRESSKRIVVEKGIRWKTCEEKAAAKKSGWWIFLLAGGAGIGGLVILLLRRRGALRRFFHAERTVGTASLCFFLS